MGLTSPVTEWGAVVVAVLAGVAIVVGWRLLARRGVLAVVGRAASLLAVNTTILFAVFLVVNDQFGFFAGWGDLLGTQQATTTTVQTGGGANAVPAAALGSKPVQLSGDGGRVYEAQVPGAKSGVSANVLVVLPADYGKVPAPAGGYPVIEAFHGWPGTPQQWLDAMHLLPALDQAVAARQIAQPIVVIPNLEEPAGRDTECVDGGAGQPQLETWLAQDVPSWVEQHYAVSHRSDAWATTGLSMGGWCANMLAVLHPDRFGAAVTFGGYDRLDLGAWKPFAAGSAAAQRYDLVDLVKADPPAVKMWALSAKSDTLSWPSTSAMAAAAHGPMSVTLLVQQQAGHRTSIWAGQVPTALDWLGSSLAGFAPSA